MIQPAVDALLKLADLHADDVLYDLGSGDGRVLTTAAGRYGVKTIGIEIDPNLVAASRESARKLGVENLVTVQEEDFLKTDLSEATVVILYLLPELHAQLIPQLRKLPPGARVLTYSFENRRSSVQSRQLAPLHHQSLTSNLSARIKFRFQIVQQ